VHPLPLTLVLGCALLGTAVAAEREQVILLHGMARTDRSMKPMAAALKDAGFGVTNVRYASRTAPIAQLSEEAIGPALAACRRAGATRIHFVTHSLGGILVRSYLSRHAVPELGRVVMLGPPNQGSEVVDKIGAWTVFGWVNGPAGRELGTAPDSTPNRLGPATVCVGVIAGDRSINWINSLMIAGPDDGKVSVERTKLDGMADHLVVHTTHPFMMRNPAVIAQTIHFLREGKFQRSEAAAGK
jgi:pimeloyl-ACP methyl ester carboxylesterase